MFFIGTFQSMYKEKTIITLYKDIDRHKESYQTLILTDLYNLDSKTRQ